MSFKKYSNVSVVEEVIKSPSVSILKIQPTLGAAAASPPSVMILPNSKTPWLP